MGALSNRNTADVATSYMRALDKKKGFSGTGASAAVRRQPIAALESHTGEGKRHAYPAAASACCIVSRTAAEHLLLEGWRFAVNL